MINFTKNSDNQRKNKKQKIDVQAKIIERKTARKPQKGNDFLVVVFICHFYFYIMQINMLIYR